MTIITPETISYVTNSAYHLFVPSNFVTRYKKLGYTVTSDKEPNEIIAMEIISYHDGKIIFKDQRGLNFLVKVEEVFDLIQEENLRMPLTFKLTYQASAINIVLKDKKLEEITGKTTVKYNLFDIIQTTSGKWIYLGQNSDKQHEYLPAEMYNNPNFDMSTFRQYVNLDYTAIDKLKPNVVYYYSRLDKKSNKKKALSITPSTIILDDIIGYMRAVICRMTADPYYKRRIHDNAQIPSIILQQQPNFLDDEIQKLRNEKII